MTVTGRRRGHGRLSKIRFRTRRRGVSDVVATILLLALTVALFASIFVFVTTFPQPTPQDNNQFQATLYPNAGFTQVLAIKITHLAGPPVAGTALVYLKSAHYPGSEFPSPYTVSSGLNGATTWNLGQVWNLTFPSGSRPSLPDNITLYIVSGSTLLFSVILPGTGIPTPPTIVSTWTTPATPAIGAAFTVNATLTGSYNPNSVFVNLAAMPGGAATAVKMTKNAQGVYGYSVNAGNTSGAAAGTYYGFVNATASTGNTTTTAAVVIILTTSGGSTNGPLSVGVILIPSPPNAGVTETVQAVVTYTGALQGKSLNVTFQAITSPYIAAQKWTSWAASGLTISGTSSLTAVAQSTWTIPATTVATSFIVYANATVGSVGTAPGVMSFKTSSLTLTPSAGGLYASTVTATGASFQPGTTVTLSLGGISVSPNGGSSCTYSGPTITIPAGGGFTCTFLVPAGASGGSNLGVATDAVSGQVATGTFTVTQWTMAMSPAAGLLGNSTTVTGTNFAANSVVSLAFDGINVSTASPTSLTCSGYTVSGHTVTTSGTGQFVCTFNIPWGAVPPTLLVATDASGPSTATAVYTVTPWAITVYPPSGSRNSTFTAYINGTGFAAKSRLSLTYNGAVIAPAACTVDSFLYEDTIGVTAAGTFKCTYSVASSATAGAYVFTATDGTSGQIASAVLLRT